MQMSKLTRNDQSKSSSTVLASTTSIDLTEPLEQSICFLVCEATASVSDLESDKKLVFVQLMVFIFLDATMDKHFAILSELDSVADNVEQNLAKTETVAFELGRHVAVHNIVELEAFVNSHRRGKVVDFFDQRTDIHPVHVELDHASFCLRQVKDIVDQTTQAFSASSDDTNMLHLLCRQVAVNQEVDHTGNAVERSADLVGHVAQEAGLLVHGLLQIALERLVVVNVGTCTVPSFLLITSLQQGFRQQDPDKVPPEITIL
jgi:hypothetical protein